LKPFDRNGIFRPAAEGGGLRRLAVRGAGVTVFSSGFGLAIQIIATVVLARLLTPTDFGVVAMVTTFSLLLMNFGLNGFTEAILQREELTHDLASNLFWVSIGAGVLLSAGFAMAGSLMARFYHNSLVAPVAVGMSTTIFFTSISVQHVALLKRAMRFSAVSVSDIIARSLSVAVSIVLGKAGWGYWALVAGAIAQPVSSAVGAFYLCRWVPGPPRRAAGTGAMIRFALNIYGRFIVNYSARNTDNLLVGWRFDAQSLGFYKKAYDLFALSASQLVSPLSNVAVSALSRLTRDSVQYRRYLLNALGVIALVGMGLGADLTLVGHDIIRLLLGPGWDPAGRIFMFFGPGIGIMLLYGTHGWIHLSIGRADRWLRWGVIEVVVTVLLFILGLHWGPAGVAVAWTASFWLLTIPSFWYAGKPIDLKAFTVVAAVWKFFVASVLAGCGSYLILRRIPIFTMAPTTLGAFLRIVIASGLFLPLYLGAVILLHRGYAPLTQLLGLVREVVPDKFSRRSPKAAAPTAAPPTANEPAVAVLSREETPVSSGK
jgi:PST family polysaccharide transporter